MRPRTRFLSLLGTLIISIAIALHVYISWFMWSYNRINRTPVKENIDLTTGHTLSRSFVPNFSAEYQVSLSLYTNQQIGERLAFFKREPFQITYRILQDGSELSAGVISNENINTIEHGAGWHSMRGPNPEILLKSGSQYELTGQVKKGSTVLNQLGPTIVVKTSYNLKGHYILLLIRGRAALWFFTAGCCLLIAAGWRHLSQKKKPENSADPIRPLSSNVE